MDKNLTVVKAKDFNITEKQAKDIEKAFMPKIKEREGYVKIYAEIIQKEISEDVCAEAGALRKKLVKVRTGLAKVHMAEKKFFRQAGLFVDAWKNRETLPVEQMEEMLGKIENHYEIIEKERTDALQVVRVKQIQKYLDPDDLVSSQYGEMDEDVWNALLSTKKQQYTDIKEAEKKRKKEEAAALVEAERLKQENVELKAEIESHRKPSNEGTVAPTTISKANFSDDEEWEDVINKFDELKIGPTFKSTKNQKLHANVGLLIDKVIKYINENKE